MAIVPDGAVTRWSGRAFVVFAAALALYRYSWLPYQANHVLFEVDQRSDEAETADPIQGMPVARDNIAMLESVAVAGQTDVNYHMLYASNARMLQRPDLARQHYDAALAIDRRPEIYLQRGFTALESGHVEAAMPDFVRAVRFNPALLDQLDGPLGERVAHEAGVQ